MVNKRNLLLLTVFAIPLAVMLSQCSTFSPEKPDPRGPLYAGSTTCTACHKDVYKDFLHTAHFTTSRPASEQNIGGSFAPGHNTFTFNQNVRVVMEKRGSGLYQVAYNNGKVENAQRFDLTFGGVKAESYLYWRGDMLYQLPMSYFRSLHAWTNSPGYDSTFADFSRPITVGCLQCHTSNIKVLGEQTKHGITTSDFDKTSLILGVDCERCHGPAADHVYYQTTHPEDKEAKHIITYASLTRIQRINMCAVCHSGSNGTMLRSTFKFKPNDNLSDYKLEDLFQAQDPAMLDVHGNQSRLLAGSKCFMMSRMDCATCHNVHQSQSGKIALFSQKCMDCHSIANHNFCKMAPVLGEAIRNNCIDCHMPAKPSNIIKVGTSQLNKVIPYLVRSHHIAIYPAESEVVINNLKKSGKLPMD